MRYIFLYLPSEFGLDKLNELIKSEFNSVWSDASADMLVAEVQDKKGNTESRIQIEAITHINDGLTQEELALIQSLGDRESYILKWYPDKFLKAILTVLDCSTKFVIDDEQTSLMEGRKFVNYWKDNPDAPVG